MNQAASVIHSIKAQQSLQTLTAVLLERPVPCLFPESDLMQETGLTSLQLVTALVRLRTYGLISWEWVKSENAYLVMEMEGRE